MTGDAEMEFLDRSLFVCSTLGLLSLVACSGGSSQSAGQAAGSAAPSSAAASSPASSSTAAPTSTAGTQPVAGSSPSSPGSPTPPAKVQRTWQTDVLLFTGDGTWATEVTNLEGIFAANGATYQEVTSAQLNAMTESQLAQFGTLLFPGGDGSTEANSLTAATHELLRTVVQQDGVGYVGFCAGAFIAVAPTPAAGQDVTYGLGIENGALLGYYYLENQGTDIAMTLESFPDGSTKDLLYYGGPVFPNTAGTVVAKYPDGNSAISEMFSGNGYVVLSAVHPTATLTTLSDLGVTSTDGIHQDLAWKLIYAAMHQQPLPTF